MSNKLEEKFLDYLEGALSEEEKRELEEAFAKDPELKRSFEGYKEIVSTERIIHMEKHELNANFSVKVMDRLEENKSFFRRYVMELMLNSRATAKVFASLVVVLGVVHLYRTMPETTYREIGSVEKIILPAAPILVKPLEDTGGAQYKLDVPASPIPPVPQSKENSVELKLDNRTAVEGWSRPGASVDIILQKEVNGKKSFEVISEQAKLLSVEKKDGESFTRIEPAPADKEKIELAKKSGSISLALRGDIDAANLGGKAPQNLTIDDLKSVPSEKKRSKEMFALSDAPASPLRRQSEPAVAASAYGAAAAPEALQAYKQGFEDTESYNSLEENIRQEVNKDPSSTFSIDVDTASYTNARRFLSSGRLPPRDSVRVEEFLNYFDYNYPKQYERPFSLSYEIAPSPLEKDRYLLKLGIKAKDKKESSKPWNLVFLVDVSGSMMDSNKLPLVQRSLRLLTENMKEGDKVSIVTYAGSAGVLLEPTTIKEKSKIISAIDGLVVGGSTNGSGGINAAYDIALKSKISDGVNRVVLATDGDFNVGVTSRDELIKLIEEKRKSGITLTTLGFGVGNLKDGTMEQLANKGNGNYYYIDSYKEARKVLETDLAGTMEVVAKDVKLQIEFNPAHVQSYRLIGYENRKLKREDFNNDAIDAGEIGTGHTVTAMYEIVLKDSELAKKLNDEYRYQDKTEEKPEVKTKDFGAELAFLKIRYKEPESSKSELLSFPIEKSNLKNSADEASGDFRFAAAVSYFGHLLRDSQYKGTYTYNDIVKLAESGRGEDKNGYRQEFIGLVKDASSIK